MIGRLGFLVWLLVVLAACVLGGCKSEVSSAKRITTTTLCARASSSAQHHVRHETRQTTRSAWNTLRASLRHEDWRTSTGGAGGGGGLAKAEMFDDDDDDDDNDDEAVTSLMGRSIDGRRVADDVRTDSEQGKQIWLLTDEHVTTRTANDGLIHAARGHTTGTERPPRV